jgi:hypothetical protein
VNWIDIMPDLPLIRGLPVIRRSSGELGILLDPSRSQGRYGCYIGVLPVDGDPQSFRKETEIWIVDWICPNLGDPQGFGYALRYACQHCDPSISYLWPAMASRWVRGETTDTDRLALAQAIADVVETKGEE